MKKFIIIVCAVLILAFVAWYAYFYLGIYVRIGPEREVTTFMKTDENTIYMEWDGQYVPFVIRGVNLGAGIPGEYATDYAIDEETYLRWFAWIQELGANTIRVYTILQDDFYNAFYDYNIAREAAGKEPLWLIHGVWVNDYVQNSHRDAYDNDFMQAFLTDSKTLVDIIHGNRNLSLGYGLGSGSYRRDVSDWVIGYILGVEWEDVTVAYTDNKYPEKNHYEGTYMYTTESASPFEAMLCEVGDQVIAYETERYGQQRLIAFSNWPTTDPFVYTADITAHFLKCASVDVEHIRTTDAFISGQFVSYHVYPYYPDYLNFTISPIVDDGGASLDMGDMYFETETGVPFEDYFYDTDLYDKNGDINTYYAYLKMLERYHTMPVIISEYGVSTGRGMAQRDANTARNQGHMTEQEQGEALIACYEDIVDAGCAGSVVFTWQDEWFKRTWNTMHAVDLDRTPYWSDYQTNEQYFGLLTFDPGEEESVSYTDGNISEWMEDDLVWSREAGDVYMKYDEKFIYFYIATDYDPEGEALYIPIDTTPKTGSTYCENYNITFDRAVDFVISIDGEDNSRVMVQERYDVYRAMYYASTVLIDPYVNTVDAESPAFNSINLVLQLLPEGSGKPDVETYDIYETGRLRYGNANPDSEDFDSLADFCFTEDGGVEIRLPWQLLNFADPSQMKIHDDYYENYGVEYIQIDEMYVGLGYEGGEGRIRMSPFTLEGWGNKVTYHERLKESYYILQAYWAEN